MRKKLISFLLAFGLLWICTRLTATASQPDAPVVNAKAAIVMDAQTGRVLFEQNAHERLPMASTTKIMTALLTLEQPELETPFVVDSRAIMVEGSSMGLQKGDTVTLRSLACGMLLPSGNDAAGAAAVRIAGSEDGFAQLMNARAEALGLTDTHFVTPSGLDSDGHYSTAYDMALLAREAMENEDFADICKNSTMTVSFGNPPYKRWLSNHNKLLKSYAGTIGIKTGFTKAAGRCLVSAAVRGGVRLIVVTLNCPDDWLVHQNLYERFFAQVEPVNTHMILPRVTIPVINGDDEIKGEWQGPQTVDAQTGRPLTVKIFAPRFLYAPIKKGQALGYAVIGDDIGGLCEMQLVSDIDVPLAEKEKTGIFDWLGLS